MTDSTITVGANYVYNSAAGYGAIGSEDQDPGDARVYYDAAIADLNDRGGILGREVVPHYHGFDAQTPADLGTAQAKWCADFTEDHEVFAILAEAPGGGPHECLTDARTPQVSSGHTAAIPQTYLDHPAFIDVAGLNLHRQARATVDGLQRLVYFDGEPRIGIVTWDAASYRDAMEGAWLPALHGLGVETSEYYVAAANSYGALGDASAAVASAVLRFRQEGIQHVIIADGPSGFFSGTGLTLLFIRAAAGQGYYPRYGMNSANSPQSGIDGGYWSAQDVPDAVAVNWSATQDAEDEGIPPNPARLRCVEVMQDRGVALPNEGAIYLALVACDQLELLRAALESSGGPTYDGLVAGVDALGSAYRSTMAYATLLGPGHHDGGAAVRLSALDAACGCFAFNGDPYPL